MRIINILPTPTIFFYTGSGKGGRRLASGEQSPSVPLERIFNPQVWKDIRTKKIQIKLEEADKQFINELLEQDKRPIEVAVLPKPVKVIKPAPKLPKTLVPSNKPRQPKVVATNLPLNFNAVDVISGKVSIKALMAQNELNKSKPMAEQVGAPVDKAAKLKEISTFMGGNLGSTLHGGRK